MFTLAVIFAVLTLIILVVGVVGMSSQNEFNKKYGNKLMQARVACQFLTVIFLLLAAMTA